MDIESAIGVVGWFIPVLFDKYITHVLEKWACDNGLIEEYEKIRSNLEYVNTVLGSVQASRKRIQNNELIGYIRKVEYLVYRAEDLLDEMQYYWLQREVESRSDYSHGTPSSASQDSVSMISTLKSYIPLSKNNNAETPASKRKTSEDHGLDRNKRTKFQRDDLSRRIHFVVEKLSELGKKLCSVLNLEKIDQIVRAGENTNTILPLKSSHLAESRVFGREEERELIINQLIGGNFANSNLSVLPIVGNGGVGKTTLARLVFNDPKIEDYFELRMWIYVSSDFDESRIIRELLEFVPEDECKGEKNLNRLLEILKKFLSSKKFLLVLDDVWEDNDKSKWERLSSLLESGEKNGSVILLTTRKLSVAKVVGEKYMRKLSGLKENDFWDLFRSYAFRDERYEKQEILQRIGKEICNKLSSYPLAAKTVGAMLRNNPSIIYWKNVRDNEEWKYQNGSDDIMPALRLSYESLPFHLQKCFSYCSLFYKGFHFYRADIVNIWIAQGFVCSNNNKMRVGDIGNIYLDNLVDSGFFDEVKIKSGFGSYFVIHDLMHDLAQMVSQHECFTIDNSYCTARGFPVTIRHLSIITETLNPWLEFSGSNLPSMNFEKNLLEIQNQLQVENLSTLIVIGGYDSKFAIALKCFLQKLKSLRVLMISVIPSHDVDLLNCDFSEFIHLRYLKLYCLGNRNDPKDLPNDLNKLYHLEVLDLRDWVDFPVLPQNVDNLASLRDIQYFGGKLHSKIARVGKLTSLQELKQFQVKKESEFEIAQLGTLIDCGGYLQICNLENVESKEEAIKARLEEKPFLSSLSLMWGTTRRYLYSSIRRVNINPVDPVVESHVLEGLKPNINLEYLNIVGYGGVTSPTWLSLLDHLVSLELNNCIAWETLPPLGILLSLKKLMLSNMPAVKEISSLFYGNGADMGFQALEKMEVRDMPELERWMGSNEGQAFPSLKTLRIERCPKLVEFSPFDFVSFGDESKKWFVCLDDVTIEGCRNLRYLSWEGLYGLVNLKSLTIGDCPELFSSFIPNEQSVQISFLPQSIGLLNISSCGITGKQLSYLLLNLKSLYHLEITDCCQITSLVADSLSGAVDLSVNKGLLNIPFSLRSTLKVLKILNCPDLVFTSKQGLRELNSIENLIIRGSPNLFSSIVSGEQIVEGSPLPSTVKILSLDNVPDKIIYSLLAPLTSLSYLSISESPQLLSLKLPTCSALKTLSITNCEMLSSLEGLLFPIHLQSLNTRNCPNLVAFNSEAIRSESPNSELVALVDVLDIDNTRFLSIPICKQLSTLETLTFRGKKVVDLTEEQEKAFLLLTSLKKLDFYGCSNLNSLPNQLCNLSSLKTLRIFNCRGIKSLPENGLPTSLESLTVIGCSDELKRHCNNITNIKSVIAVN